ncbi:arginine--tRNA ligase [Paractinoplanes deccanensis]|uniref:Arginine--tRNA ligase n=1 Tax=Paractinoplanes deccanensis TaxID=113561 RepID=A0ABQ3Y6Q8_9ACTN|nr:arginine--tRNA ligase [Actinoplanes deccanensis]GID75663.1 arginine--tRNA ligase [Actinoplanes deccanensis]
MDVEAFLAGRLAPAFEAVAGRPVDPAVRPSQHADFQSGAALALAKELGRPPREIAAEVAGKSGLSGVTLSGPGFLNLTVDNEVLVGALRTPPAAPRAAEGQRVVVDYSSPNVAKEMHVGHLRSTIIGDALARLLESAGHDVVRVNHLGDWGTQFGMLIEQLADDDHEGASLGDLTELYRLARARFDGDDDFRTRARLRVVALQGGDPASRSLWRRLVAQSEASFLDIYHRLGIGLAPGDFVGESFYQPMLADVVAELTAKGLLVESEGALCAFPEGFAGRDGEPLPLIVRKSDGGFGYAATDLAAVRHRTRELHATRLLYVVGAPQRTHFQMVFAVARQAGWLGGATAEHIGFGSILGADGKMFKTRSGDTIKLAGLLDEAVARATDPAIGIGAIKYADLASDRRSDYVFDWDRMLAASGNTGPYLQYAVTRIRSILAKAADAPGAVVLGDPAERRLALALAGLEPAIAAATEAREPHRLAGYLHDLAVAFTTFYEKCPILKSGGATRASRLTLTARTGETLTLGLGLLGIPLPAVM